MSLRSTDISPKSILPLLFPSPVPGSGVADGLEVEGGDGVGEGFVVGGGIGAEGAPEVIVIAALFLIVRMLRLSALL